MKSEETDSQEKKYHEVINRKKPNYYYLVGIDILDVKQRYAKLKMNYDKKIVNPYGTIAGGFYAVIADTSMACALLGTMEDTPSRNLVCIEYKVNMIKPVKKGFVISEAKVIHLGKKIAVGDVKMWDDDGSIVATALITYSIRF